MDFDMVSGELISSKKGEEFRREKLERKKTFWIRINRI